MGIGGAIGGIMGYRSGVERGLAQAQATDARLGQMRQAADARTIKMLETPKWAHEVEEKKLKLEVGKTYRTRDGKHERTIKSLGGSVSSYPVTIVNSAFMYRSNGNYWKGGESEEDLTQEVTKTPTLKLEVGKTYLTKCGTELGPIIGQDVNGFFTKAGLFRWDESGKSDKGLRDLISEVIKEPKKKEKPPLSLKLGGTYRSNEGKVVTLRDDMWTCSDRKWFHCGGDIYQSDGQCHRMGLESPKSLKEEIIETPTPSKLPFTLVAGRTYKTRGGREVTLNSEFPGGKHIRGVYKDGVTWDTFLENGRLYLDAENEDDIVAEVESRLDVMKHTVKDWTTHHGSENTKIRRFDPAVDPGPKKSAFMDCYPKDMWKREHLQLNWNGSNDIADAVAYSAKQLYINKPKTKENKMTGLKEFFNQHSTTIWTIVFVLLIDEVFLGGRLKGKANKMLDKVLDSTDQKRLT